MPPRQLRILIIDDEPALLRLMQDFLKRSGHSAHAESSPAAALSLFARDPEQFDVAIVDWSMPEMPGADVAASLAALRPGLPILICSGYSLDLSSLPESIQACAEILAKPFVPRMLAAAVEELAKRNRPNDAQV